MRGKAGGGGSLLMGRAVADPRGCLHHLMIGRSSEGAGGWSLSTTIPWNPSKDPQQFSTMIEEEEEENEEEEKNKTPRYVHT
jgi:hypothetical protein